MTAERIVFGRWETVVENDELLLVRLNHALSPSTITFPEDGFSLSLPNEVLSPYALHASFLSKEKRAVIHFKFERAPAFRVLDEGGLLQLWQASAETPRPGRTTFKVRGHAWQNESELIWFMAGTTDSYMIATGWNCLEVVAKDEPLVEVEPAEVVWISKEGA